jgi:hypothetical protein
MKTLNYKQKDLYNILKKVTDDTDKLTQELFNSYGVGAVIAMLFKTADTLYNTIVVNSHNIAFDSPKEISEQKKVKQRLIDNISSFFT